MDQTNSVVLHRYIISDVLVALVQTAREKARFSSTIPAWCWRLMTGRFPVRRGRHAQELCSAAAGTTRRARRIRGRAGLYPRSLYGYDLSLDRLAHEFNLSATYLSRLIKKAAGQNYKDYVIHLRIDEAKRFLMAGMSVADTCEKIGYVNISHFIKTFKQLTGQTPSGYKKEPDQPTRLSP